MVNDASNLVELHCFDVDLYGSMRICENKQMI